MDERGGNQDLPWKKFCLTVPKDFVGESFSVALISGTEKIWRRGGGCIKTLRRKFIVSQCRKVSCGNPLLLNYFRLPKKFGEEGVSRFYVEKFLSNNAENSCRGIFRCCINFQ